MSRDILAVTTGGVLLLLSGENPGTLLQSLQRTGQSPTTNYPAQNVNSAKMEKACSGSRDEVSANSSAEIFISFLCSNWPNLTKTYRKWSLKVRFWIFVLRKIHVHLWIRTKISLLMRNVSANPRAITERFFFLMQKGFLFIANYKQKVNKNRKSDVTKVVA